MSIVLSGIQPTGHLHLGNYLGALKNWVSFQKTHKCFFCIVDLHALTVPQDPVVLRQDILTTAATYIACGIDPSVSAIFPQSAVSGHAELGWLLGTLTPLGWLNRMTQFKEKSGKDKENAGLGLFAYPVLMTADILLYRATHVPVGHDQKQHLELARDIAVRFNNQFNVDFFPSPEPMILGPIPRVMSLRDGLTKMSKSDTSGFSRIELADDEDTIRLKIQKAKTDGGPMPDTVDQMKNRPEILNLMTLYAALTHKDLSASLEEFSGKNFSTLKEKLSEALIETLAPIRDNMTRLLKDTSHLENILKQGIIQARNLAEPTLQATKEIMGLPNLL